MNVEFLRRRRGGCCRRAAWPLEPLGPAQSAFMFLKPLRGVQICTSTITYMCSNNLAILVCWSVLLFGRAVIAKADVFSCGAEKNAEKVHGNLPPINALGELLGKQSQQ